MDMNIRVLNALSSDERRQLYRRAETDIEALLPLAREVADKVRTDGDAALMAYTKAFDKVELSSLRVTADEIERGYCAVDTDLRATLEYAYKNIHNFHAAQLPQEYTFKTVDNGLFIGEKTTSLRNVALYVPRGKGSFPSVLLMLAIPAVVAGVKNIVILTPPNPEGEVDAPILAAAKIIGINEIYKVGGIQAVAAVAFGTQTVPKCDKIVGPGSAYVTAAKRALAAYIDIGPLAGPSESIILCDEHTDPLCAALDLMVEAEHGSDSAAVLVTHSKELIEKIQALIEEQLGKVSDVRRKFITDNLSGYGGAVLTNSLEESIAFTNDYAPEHLEILTSDPFRDMMKIDHAGEILLGQHAPITLGNYLLGLNAILPTGGNAHTYSGVSVHDFMKRSSIGYVTREGFEGVRTHAARFATAEGFDAHALAITDRP